MSADSTSSAEKGARPNRFREQYERAKARNAQLPLHARWVITGGLLADLAARSTDPTTPPETRT